MANEYRELSTCIAKLLEWRWIELPLHKDGGMWDTPKGAVNPSDVVKDWNVLMEAVERLEETTDFAFSRDCDLGTWLLIRNSVVVPREHCHDESEASALARCIQAAVKHSKETSNA